MNWWSCHINRKDSFFLKLDTVYRKHLESANLHKNTVQCLEENMQISQNVHLPNILSTSSRNFYNNPAARQTDENRSRQNRDIIGKGNGKMTVR